MNPTELPLLPDPPRKNDALFLFGLTQPLPWVCAYAQKRTEVVHGPSCDPAREIHLDQCRADSVPVVARRGGGGTVVLAPGMVVVGAVGARRDNEIRSVYRLVQDAIARVLEKAGVQVSQRGISDLAVDGRKVAGSSLYLPREPHVYFYQCSLLVHGDLAVLDRYLAHPPREPDYREGRGHGTFCTTLRDAGCKLDAVGIALLLERELSREIAGAA